MAARLGSVVSNRKSVLNESYQMLTQQTNLSINQSFNSPKQFSNTQSFLIPSQLNCSIRDSAQSVRFASPSLRVKTEKPEREDQRQKQLVDATLKLLAQNEKLEQLVSQQNKMIQLYKDDKEELELKLKRANDEIMFLKETNQNRLGKLTKQLQHVQGKSQHQQKKFTK